MDTIESADIRFFHLTSRIGRVRYLGYSVGLSLLCLPLVALTWALALISPAISTPLAGVISLAATVLSIAFGVRRLHDLDKSGFWMLLLLVPLANLGLLIYLIFFPGSAGDNRFGDEPPSNSGWVILGAAVYVACIPLSIVALSAYSAFARYGLRSEMEEAVAVAGKADAAVGDYVNANKGAWPATLDAAYPAAKQGPLGLYVAKLDAVTVPDGSAYGIVVTMKTEGVPLPIAGSSMEVWTHDGVVWYCGPGGPNPVNVTLLPTGCHTTDPKPL